MWNKFTDMLFEDTKLFCYIKIQNIEYLNISFHKKIYTFTFTHELLWKPPVHEIRFLQIKASLSYLELYLSKHHNLCIVYVLSY